MRLSCGLEIGAPYLVDASSSVAVAPRVDERIFCFGEFVGLHPELCFPCCLVSLILLLFCISLQFCIKTPPKASRSHAQPRKRVGATLYILHATVVPVTYSAFSLFYKDICTVRSHISPSNYLAFVFNRYH